MYNFLIYTIFHLIKQNDPLNQWFAISTDIRKHETVADLLSCLNIFIYKGNMTAFWRHVNKGISGSYSLYVYIQRLGTRRYELKARHTSHIISIYKG